MKTCTEIRRENARALATDGPAAFARRLSDVSDKPVTNQYVNMVMGPSAEANDRGIGDDVARRIELAYGKERGWLDHDHSRDILDASISGINNALSEQALELIMCVARLDGLGDLAHKTFVWHTGLLQLSAAFSEFQTASARAQMLEETERLLSPRLENPGAPHGKGRN